MSTSASTPAPAPRRIAITGSSGMVGSALVPALAAAGHEVVRVVRSRPTPSGDAVYWKPSEGVIDAPALEGCDAVIHLAGETIAQRWSSAAKPMLTRPR